MCSALCYILCRVLCVECYLLCIVCCVLCLCSVLSVVHCVSCVICLFDESTVMFAYSENRADEDYKELPLAFTLATGWAAQGKSDGQPLELKRNVH